MSGSPTRTLQLRRPFGRSLALAALFLLLYLLLAEALFRLAPLRPLLGAPGLGSEHRQFEQQWARLEDYAAQQEVVECLMIGDSTVMSNFAPEAFAGSYFQQTGEKMACYNFGVGAFTVVGLSTLAELLIQEYSPRLFIVGVEALNFTVAASEQGNADLSRVPWARYKLGDFNVEGWLYEHTHLYPYIGVLGQLITYEAGYSQVLGSAEEERRVVQDGYFPPEGRSPFDVSQPPDLAWDHPYIEHYAAELGSFEMLPENLAALNRIMALDTEATRIILVEMPVPATFYTFFGNGEQDYQLFIDTLSQRAATQAVPFWRVENRQLLPSTVWFNYNHLNREGAPIFSSWLGTKAGQQRQASAR